jgi:hypothetical protein
MSQTAPYLQFPLCALSFGETETERLNAILDYGVVDAGVKLWRKLVPDLQNRLIIAWGRCRNLPTGFNGKFPLHCAALYGAQTLKVKFRDIRYLLENHTRLAQYTAEFERRYGRNPLVRVKLAWLLKVRNHKGIIYREFAVLCAVFSCIGDKPFARVTQSRIRLCALGYKTAQVMEAEIARRTDGASPLTVRQLRDTIARLHRNKFFARCTYARRMTYYSIRGNDRRLRQRVKERHTYASAHRLRQAAKDQAMTAAIRRAKAAYRP